MTELEEIVEALNKHQQRATYSAVAGVLNRIPIGLMADKPRSPRYSWVVAVIDGQPTGYAESEKHPDLLRQPNVITTKDELLKWLRGPI